MTPDGFIRASCLSDMKPFVSAVRGQCTLTKSLCNKSSSRANGGNVTPISFARTTLLEEGGSFSRSTPEAGDGLIASAITTTIPKATASLASCRDRWGGGGRGGAEGFVTCVPWPGYVMHSVYHGENALCDTPPTPCSLIDMSAHSCVVCK